MVTMDRVVPLEDATPLLTDHDALRARAAEKGVLFFRGLLDPASVLNVRAQVLALCDAHGWLSEGGDPNDALANADARVVETRDPRWKDFYCDLQRVRDFHALALHPGILGALGALFDGPVLPHPRNICRVVFPDTAAHSTPPHQDNLYIGGSEQTWTAWIPLGDVPADLGGLAVAEGTHRGGRLEDHAGTGAGGRQVTVPDAATWVTGDYACGDVIFLHSLTVHQGRDNTSDRLRLSCDFRYQPQRDPVRSDSLEPHMGWLTWDDVYDTWEADDPVRYYWRSWDLDVFQRADR